MEYRIAFILEQALGHITHSRNLQANITRTDQLNPLWLPIPYDVSGFESKIPLYKSNWTVRSGMRARKSLKEASRTGQLDGLFFHTQVPAVLCGGWIRSYTSIISLDATPIQFDELGDFYQHHPGPQWLEGFKNNMNRSALNSARRIVAWTEWTKKSLEKDYGIPPEKTVVIPPGVIPSLWKKPAGFEKKGDNKTRFLFVGGDLLRKGGDLLINAFRTLSASRKDENLELHLVTKTPVEPGNGIYVYSDFGSNDPRLISLYHQCDIFVLPTSGDCLPMVLSEAGAAGLPSISTTVAGIPEIIIEGQTGLLIPPGDEKALFRAMDRLVSDADLRLKMGANAVEKVTTQFDAVKNANKLVNLIMETVQENQPAQPKRNQ